eukprot:1154756-Pelagomonas_calceolata.AAC.1
MNAQDVHNAHGGDPFRLFSWNCLVVASAVNLWFCSRHVGGCGGNVWHVCKQHRKEREEQVMSCSSLKKHGTRTTVAN